MEKGKPVACHRDWPLFYMNDFSRLGLVVSNLTRVLAQLRTDGFTVIDDSDLPLVEISQLGQLAGVVQSLTRSGLSCEVSDLVSCAYQG
jgi:hypothetical protein